MKSRRERVPVVDRSDAVIGEKFRDELSREDDITRVSGIWIENEHGEALIAQRGKGKTNSPGRWGPAAAGTNEIGETYLSNIIKETLEEIGVMVSKDQLYDIGVFYEETSHKYFAGIFYAQIKKSTEFVLEKPAVADVKWVTWADLEKDTYEQPENYLISMEQGIMKYIHDWKNNVK